MARAAIVDVDGALVDTNYHHAIAWQRALRHHGIVFPAWRIHRHIGMGGEAKLRDAGALAVFESAAELREDLDRIAGSRIAVDNRGARG